MGDSAITRRTVLRAAGAGIAAAVTGVGQATGSPPKTAVVIGSGFGGAVAAYRLGTAGIETIVLERGRRWPTTGAGDTFCSSAAPDRRAAWFSDSPVLSPVQQITPIQRYAGVLDAVRGNGLVSLYGAGVGGGSLVFGGFLAQPRRRDFQATFPRELDYTELADVYYPRARKNLGGSPLPDDILAHPDYLGARSWLRDIADAGFEPHFFDFGIDWDVVRAELTGERVRAISMNMSARATAPTATSCSTASTIDARTARPTAVPVSRWSTTTPMRAVPSRWRGRRCHRSAGST